MAPSLIWIAEFNGDVYFLRFQPEIPFLAKFGPKNQNCQFKVKLDTETNSSMQISVVMFTFHVFGWKYFFGQIWSKKSKLSVLGETWYLD